MKIKIVTTLIFLMLTFLGYTQKQSFKFMGYSSYERDDLSLKTYCRTYKRHTEVVYGTERVTIASFYDRTRKQMIYIQKSESRKEYCNYYGFWFTNWEHKGFRDDFVEGRIYYFDLKKIEYTKE